LHEDSQEISFVKLLVPAVKITLPGEFKRAGRTQFEAEALLHFLAEPIHAALGDDVFKARVFAVGAVAEIAVDVTTALAVSITWSGVMKPITSARRA
jgi:hypothetical protein